MVCPVCQKEMGSGALYVRGFGTSLHWSARKDVSFLSRRDLEQIDLSQVSLVPPSAQAVLDGWRCDECGLIAFETKAAE
jgi:hypothetical protein